MGVVGRFQSKHPVSVTGQHSDTTASQRVYEEAPSALRGLSGAQAQGRGPGNLPVTCPICPEAGPKAWAGQAFVLQISLVEASASRGEARAGTVGGCGGRFSGHFGQPLCPKPSAGAFRDLHLPPPPPPASGLNKVRHWGGLSTEAALSLPTPQIIEPRPHLPSLGLGYCRDSGTGFQDGGSCLAAWVSLGRPAPRACPSRGVPG